MVTERRLRLFKTEGALRPGSRHERRAGLWNHTPFKGVEGLSTARSGDYFTAGEDPENERAIEVLGRSSLRLGRYPKRAKDRKKDP